MEQFFCSESAMREVLAPLVGAEPNSINLEDAQFEALQRFRDGEQLMFRTDQVESIVLDQAGDRSIGEIKELLSRLRSNESPEVKSTQTPIFIEADKAGYLLGMGAEKFLKRFAVLEIADFQDGERLLFKSEQVIAIAKELRGDAQVEQALGQIESGMYLVELDDIERSRQANGVSLPDNGAGSEVPHDTGISVFDTDHDMQVNGSQLLDLTGEVDDTSLGAELLEEVYSRNDEIEIPANASGLFESDELEIAAVGAASGLLDLTRGDDTSLGAELLEEIYSSEEDIEFDCTASGLFEMENSSAPITAGVKKSGYELDAEKVKGVHLSKRITGVPLQIRVVRERADVQLRVTDRRGRELARSSLIHIEKIRPQKASSDGWKVHISQDSRGIRVKIHQSGVSGWFRRTFAGAMKHELKFELSSRREAKNHRVPLAISMNGIADTVLV